MALASGFCDSCPNPPHAHKACGYRDALRASLPYPCAASRVLRAIRASPMASSRQRRLPVAVPQRLAFAEKIKKTDPNKDAP
jgi:hypothetical protein